jgi:hypothetical protein
MRRTLYAIATLALITSAACNKEDEDIDNVPDKGTVRFINTSADRYNIYLDGHLYGNLYGDDTAIFPKIDAGSHPVRAEQIEPIPPAPVLRQKTIVVQKDSTATFIFP